MTFHEGRGSLKGGGGGRRGRRGEEGSFEALQSPPLRTPGARDVFHGSQTNQFEVQPRLFRTLILERSRLPLHVSLMHNAIVND